MSPSWLRYLLASSSRSAGLSPLADAVGHQAESEFDEYDVADETTHAMELPFQLGDYELLEELGRGGVA